MTQCEICGKELIKRKTESMPRFSKRTTCSQECNLKKIHEANIGHSMNAGKIPWNKDKTMSKAYRDTCRRRQLGVKRKKP